MDRQHFLTNERLFAFVPAYAIFKRSEGNLNMPNQNTEKLVQHV
jgi:hypothetical protein